MGDNLQDPDKDAVDELKVGYSGTLRCSVYAVCYGDEQKCSVPVGTCEFCFASVIFPSLSRSFCARVSADILLLTFNLSILYYFVK
jgi:hypothetical protein